MDNSFETSAQKNLEMLRRRKQQQEKTLTNAIRLLIKNDIPPEGKVGVQDAGVPLVNLVKAIGHHLGIDEAALVMPAKLDINDKSFETLKNLFVLQDIRLRKVKLEPGWQERDNGPLIGCWEDDLVALIPQQADKYKIYDPIQDTLREISASDLTNLKDAAYACHRGLSSVPPTLKEYFKLIFGQSWGSDISLIALGSVFLALLPLLVPFITETIFADIVPTVDYQAHIMVVQVMVVSAFATAGASIARNVAIMRISYKARLNFEAALWLKLLSLPTKFFRQYQSGNLANRMQAVHIIGSALSSTAVATIINTMLSILSLAIMFYYSWKLALTAMGVLTAYLTISATIAWFIVKYKRAEADCYGKTAGQSLQIINGITKFRVKNAETEAFYLWAKAFSEEWKYNRKARVRKNWLDTINSVQSVIMSMLVFAVVMYWMSDDPDNITSLSITVPEFMGFISASGALNSAVLGFIPLLISILDVIPVSERLLPVLHAQSETVSAKSPAGSLSGRIEINNISFRYDEDRPLIIDKLSLSIQPGQFVALVGASGCGKSTLIRLLLGFEKPESGSIYYDHHDLAEVNINSVRSQIGVVLQNSQLMPGDILSNLTGSLPLTVDDAWEAAALTGLADDIKAMPMGMSTLISEGALNVSGGQKQRILIARSIINQPKILIFDEATSALDNETQKTVSDSIDRLNVVRIVVAHRLSTIINADVIHVMDKGTIVESGTYQELLERGGLFGELAKRQLI